MLPDGWETKKLGEFMDFKNGVNAEKEAYGTGIKFVNVMDIFGHDFLLQENVRGSMIVDEKQQKEYSVCRGDILFNRTSETENDIAMTAVYMDDQPIIFGGFVIRGRQNNPVLLSEYAGYCFRSNTVRREIVRRGQGAIRTNIGQKDLSLVPILIPAKSEQQAITDILIMWDQTIHSLNELIKQKQRQKKALMQRLLTGKHRFPEFEGQEWQEVELGDIFKEVKTKVGQKRVMPHSITAGRGFVSHEEKWGKDISGAQNENYTLLTKGQFAYNKGNSKKYACGCMYLFKEDSGIAVPNVFISFERRKDNVCNEFYEQYFIADYCARELKKYITSGARSDGLLNLSKPNFFSIKIPLPPHKEQEKIAAVLASADKEIDLLTQKLEAYQEQKKGLMQQLLTGKKRVKSDQKEKAVA